MAAGARLKRVLVHTAVQVPKGGPQSGGVVGETPVLKPGQRFVYHSGCTLDTQVWPPPPPPPHCCWRAAGCWLLLLLSPT